MMSVDVFLFLSLFNGCRAEHAYILLPVSHVQSTQIMLEGAASSHLCGFHQSGLFHRPQGGHSLPDGSLEKMLNLNTGWFYFTDVVRHVVSFPSPPFLLASGMHSGHLLLLKHLSAMSNGSYL